MTSDAASQTPQGFDGLELRAGMTREEAEKAIAISQGKERSEYSPYGNNLQGGTIEYVDPKTAAILEVTYKAGAPAPWVENASGVAEHYPPVDESVLTFRIRRP
jgi:hypothetical protein